MYFQKYRFPHLVHKIHIVKEARSSSTGRNNHIFKLGHFMKHLFFKFAKSFFAPTGEKLSDRFVKTLFDIPVQIDKRNRESAGKRFTQCRFAGSHIRSEERRV